MNTRLFLFSFVVGLMLAEARLSARNTRELKRRGAVEPPGDALAALSVTYILAFLAMGVEGVWRAAVSGPARRPVAPPGLPGWRPA